MLIKQLSVFLENKTGRLYEAADILAKNNVNIRALALADTSDFGVLRMIVNHPEKAARCLRDSGLTVAVTEVIAVEVSDRPGGFAEAARILSDAGIAVEYMYAFVEKRQDNAILVFRVENIDKTVHCLVEKGLKVLKAKDALSL